MAKSKGDKETDTKSKKKKSPTKNQESKPIQVNLEWSSPERIWRPKGRLWYLGYGGLFAFLIIIAARLGPPFSTIVILGMIALLFLWFVQGTIEPLVSEHKITSRGIITRDTLFRWDDLQQFWIGKKKEHTILYLDPERKKQHPRIMILIDKIDDQQVFDSIISHIRYATTKEAGYNLVAKVIYGVYMPMSNYLEDLDQPK